MIGARLVLLCLCLPLLACGGLSPVPGAGGDAWYEVRGPHFRVLSDLDRAELASHPALAPLGVYPEELESILDRAVDVERTVEGFA